MKTIKVQYTVQSEYASKNRENLKNVIAEIKRLNNPDIKYITFILDDNKSFVHFGLFNSDEASHIFRDLESFTKFRKELDNSDPEIPPKVENIFLVDSSFSVFENDEQQTKIIIDRFNEAFIKHNPSLLNDIVGTDCRMEGAMPPPDGMIVEGYQNCLDFWKSLIENPNAQFMPEKVTVNGNKATIQWKFMWGEKLEKHIKGVNLMTIQDNKITEAVGYVKGELR